MEQHKVVARETATNLAFMTSGSSLHRSSFIFSLGTAVLPLVVVVPRLLALAVLLPSSACPFAWPFGEGDRVGWGVELKESLVWAET
jgi:hypothetical protein